MKKKENEVNNLNKNSNITGKQHFFSELSASSLRVCAANLQELIKIPTYAGGPNRRGWLQGVPAPPIIPCDHSTVEELQFPLVRDVDAFYRLDLNQTHESTSLHKTKCHRCLSQQMTNSIRLGSFEEPF